MLAYAHSLFRNLFRKSRLDRDLDDEIRSHLELMTDQNLHQGMSPGAAARAARVELGGVEQVKEQSTRSPRRRMARNSPARPSLRRAPASQEPRLHGRRRAHAGPRHRREHRDFLGGQHGSLETVRLSRPRADRDVPEHLSPRARTGSAAPAEFNWWRQQTEASSIFRLTTSTLPI